MDWNNIFPETVIASTRRFFDNQIFYDGACSEIQASLKAYTEGKDFTSRKMYLDGREVHPLVLQMAVDKVIEKFLQLPGEGQFLCLANGVPLFIGREKGQFKIVVHDKLRFDTKRGFADEDNRFDYQVLNNQVTAGKNPMFPPNIITDTSCPKSIHFDLGRGYRPLELDGKGCFRIEPHPPIMDELCALLKARGHSCASIVGMYDHEFKWCGKDICPSTKMYDDMRKRQAKQEQLVHKLRAEGHKCISIAESYPMQVFWCNQTPCKRANMECEDCDMECEE